MNSKAWLILLAFVVWMCVSWRWYACGIMGFCGDTPAASAVVSSADQETDDFDLVRFTKDKERPDFGKGWSAHVDSLMQSTGAQTVLMVFGPWSREEQGGRATEALGVARAEQIIDHLKTLRSGISYEAASKLRDSLDKGYLYGVDWQVLERNDKVEERLDGATIRFPYKSDEKLEDAEIDAYLKRLAARMQQEGLTVRVVGHTDDKGSEGYNERLALERAESIKAILVRLGVLPDQVKTESKGETEPLVPNDSEINKAKNRRTEIIIENDHS